MQSPLFAWAIQLYKKYILIDSKLGFFLDLGLAGYIGLINYIFEVEGSDLKHGLTTLVNLLESKNPIFCTVIGAMKDGSFAQTLTAKSTSS